MLDQELAAHSPTYANTIARLNEITLGFYETGVAIFTDDTRQSTPWKAHKEKRKATCLLFPHSLRKYLRRIAGELKRPYVQVDHVLKLRWDAKTVQYITGTTVETWHLTLPRTKYTQALVSDLMLLDPQAHFNTTQNEPLLKSGGTNRRAGFLFQGTKGKEIFEHWLKQCKEDPDFRKALRLPPNVTPGGNHDIIGRPTNPTAKHRRPSTRHDRAGRGTHSQDPAGPDLSASTAGTAPAHGH